MCDKDRTAMDLAASDDGSDTGSEQTLVDDDRSISSCNTVTGEEDSNIRRRKRPNNVDDVAEELPRRKSLLLI